MTHHPRPKTTPKPRVVKTVGHMCINAKGLNVHPPIYTFKSIRCGLPLDVETRNYYPGECQGERQNDRAYLWPY